MATLKLAGCDLHYEVHGTGPALVLVHGLSGNHMSWWQQVDHFASRFKCVIFSHRGFLPSTGDAEPARFLGDLSALIDHLDQTSVTLVAQAMGGWECISYMHANPGRVSALVLASSVGGIDLGNNVPVSGKAAVVDGELFHVAAGPRMAREQPALHRLFCLIDGWNSKMDKRAVRDGLLQLPRLQPREVSKSRVPIMWIFGTEDNVPQSTQDAVAAAFSPSAVKIISQAGHSTYFERAAVFNSIVDQFLTSELADPDGRLSFSSN